MIHDYPPYTFRVPTNGASPLLPTVLCTWSTFPVLAQEARSRGLDSVVTGVWVVALVLLPCISGRTSASPSVRGGLFWRPLSPSSLCPQYFCWPLLSRNSVSPCLLLHWTLQILFFEVIYFFLASFSSFEPQTIRCSPTFYPQTLFSSWKIWEKKSQVPYLSSSV